MAVTGISHKAGLWKQQNKSHKTGRHRSKGQIDVQNKGRVSVKNLSTKQRKVLQKASRRNRSQQIRSSKREEVLNRKRLIGTGQSPPHLVTLIPLHESVDVKELSAAIQCCDEESSPSFAPLSTGGFTINLPRLKHRYQIILPTSSTISDVLNCVRVTDSVVFLIGCNDNCMDKVGVQLLECLIAQGLPASVFYVQGIDKMPIKQRSSTKKEITKQIEQYMSAPKLLTVDTPQETLNLLRCVGEMKHRGIGMRSGRSYMLVEKSEFVCEDNESTGTLKISGHVRGSRLDVNKLVHLVGWGDFQIQQIEKIAEHCPWKMSKNRNQNNEMSTDEKMVSIRGEMYQPFQSFDEFLLPDPAQQQDLTREAEVDPLDGEQTWPTEEELREAEDTSSLQSNKKKLQKRVPKGTSDYQASWILDENEDWEEASGSEIDEDAFEDREEFQPCDEELSQADEDEAETASVMMSEMEDTASQYDDKMEDDQDQLARFREQRTNEMFPDEIDTPATVNARTRFQRYRGLKSFRTSPWDPKENLPSEYARIFQFQSFENMKKRIKKMETEENSSVEAGTYVTVYLKDVPKSFVNQASMLSTITMFSLFPHEQKMSVLHFALKSCTERSIKSKDELIFHVGFRQFKARPLFSQHTVGSKHKLERFLPTSGVVVASVYAPITFPPANVVAFVKDPNGDLEQVANGTLFKVDPDRVVVKRIVLSGHPFRINKRAATIRYMFFNPDDVLWFKPVELRTKWGRRGHIKEPLGTHGHMKCIFDSQLTSQDTVMMMLYKRVFPKWSYCPITPNTESDVAMEESFDEELFT
uniref:Pre-rRNA-processing protein TSR1 homolog n=1 Tax=Phallusia mammillata TaxID=59560 RepID=A0A6F9DWD1_9ASCI|nr:pre-rRNA-processing protein TSR1 homolog [Phallusia mammillata]